MVKILICLDEGPLHNILTHAFSNSGLSNDNREAWKSLFEVIDSKCISRKSNFSDQGLLLACAKAKDASTLSRVLQFDQEGDDRTNDFDNRENPLVAASLTNHVECIRLLYNAGYRIRLAEEDSRAVSGSFEVPESSLYTRMISLTWSLFTDDEEQQTLDPVVRFLKFKAFTNPHYLTLDTLRDRKLQVKRVFRL